MASVQVVSAKSAFSEDTHIEKSMEPEQTSTNEETVTEVVEAVDHYSDADTNEEEAAKPEDEDAAADDADDETAKEAAVASDVMKVASEEPKTDENCTSEENVEDAKEAIEPEVLEEGKAEKAEDDGCEEENKAIMVKVIDEATKELEDVVVAEENIMKEGKGEGDEGKAVSKNEESVGKADSKEMSEEKVGEEETGGAEEEEEGKENSKE